MAELTVEIGEAPFAPEPLIQAFREGQADACGAIASFTGVMRSEGGAAERLYLQHYPGFTEREVRRIAGTAADRFSLQAVLVRHRVGEIAPGEPIVLVATAARHRREAFEACDSIMDFLKSAAPFWKKEAGPKGERWIEPTERDLADRKRWED
ncbi:molybdenum cofactor biosynthesis protein MoaE [Parvularcula dongshanensis]|uniref:Molybdopterin synthase catalytic subunit n=1 Tax=Parvularcula dongshanensis TaxID=1173995 RepID=A0A840I7C9_9PROT|nr:molybdopterin synthase catalytic subunit [Parvularcula dongshanensis]